MKPKDWIVLAAGLVFVGASLLGAALAWPLRRFLAWQRRCRAREAFWRAEMMGDRKISYLREP